MIRWTDVLIKETGRWVRYEYRDAWGVRMYSFDRGVTWTRSKVQAYRDADAAGKLQYVDGTRPALKGENAMISTVQGRSLLDFGTDVARHLSLTQPGEWSASWPAGEPSWCVYLTREDGARLILGRRDYQTRFDASGTFPTTKGGNYYGPYAEHRLSITLADTKTPDQVAKDLARRLLPTYLPQYAKAITDQAWDTAQAEVARNVALGLAELIGEEASEYNGRGWRISRHGNGGPSVAVEVDPYQSARRVKVTLDDLTPEEVRDILQAVPVTP